MEWNRTARRLLDQRARVIHGRSGPRWTESISVKVDQRQRIEVQLADASSAWLRPTVAWEGRATRSWLLLQDVLAVEFGTGSGPHVDHGLVHGPVEDRSSSAVV